MDAKDIELDLQALQRLYGLLNGDGQSTTTSDKGQLDEHARLLLKNLLDTETQRVFKAHSELIAGQLRSIDVNLERNGSVYASGSEYRKKRCRVCQGSTLKQLKPIEGTKFYYDETQNPKEVVTLQNQQKNQFNHFLWDNEQRMGSMVRYKVDESLNSEIERKIGTYDSKLSDVGSTALSSNRVITGADEVCNSTTETSKEPFEIDYLSKEASEAIKQIELRISALQLGAELLQKNNYVQETKSPRPVLQPNDGVVPLIELSRDRESSVSGNDIQYKLTSQRLKDPFESPFYQVPIRTTNQPKETKLPNLMSSHPSNMVQRTDSMVGQSTSSMIRSRGPTMGRDTLEKLGKSTEEPESFTNWPAYFSSQTERENPYQNQMAMKERISKHETFQPYLPFTSSTDFGKNYRNIQSVVSGHKVTQRFPHKIMGSNSRDKPAKLLVPSSFHEYQSDQHHGVSTKTNYKSPLRNISSRHQELEGTPTSSYSSNWTSQQASSLGSESEERSIPVRNRRTNYMSFGSSSDSTAYFPSHDTESHNTSYTSNSEDEVYSSESSAGADQVTSSSGHNSEGNSLYDQPICHHTGPSYSSMKPINRRSGPTKIRKSAHRISQQKQSGKWKRLKDRLAIIFHHHHHHHHYDDDSDDQKKMSHSKPLQKNTGKNFRSRMEEEAYEEQAVEKLGKSLIRDRPGKNQRKHFHGLMGGLLRHVKHSKKSKPATHSIPQLGKGQQHGAKKPLKKSNWWQLLQHHRGSKFPNKPPHVKLGLKKKKAHLRVLPKMK